jgi:hypothetical protein
MKPGTNERQKGSVAHDVCQESQRHQMLSIFPKGARSTQAPVICMRVTYL